MARRGRIPRPWYRAGVDRWYVTLDGEQIPLGKTKREAMAEFARIQASRGQAVVVARLTVGQLADLWLADRTRAVKAITIKKTYRPIVESWVEFAGGLLVVDVRPYHVDQWLDRLDGVRTQSTRHLRISVVKMMSRWAMVKGYCDRDPLFGVKAPTIERRSPTTRSTFDAAIAAASPELREMLAVLALTGVRAGELASMTVERTDLAGGQAHVVGKSGPRTVWLSSAAVEALRRLIGDRTSGQIWPGLTAPRLNCRIQHLKRRTGIRDFSAHRLRGLFSTEAIRAGVDSLIVSQLLGHKDPSIVAKHYAAPDAEMLRDAAERASGGAQKKAPPKRGR